MRIVLTTDTVGGVWTFTRELTQELIAHGQEVALVSFGRSPSHSQERWCEELAARSGGRFCFHASSTPLEWMQENASCFSEGFRTLAGILNEFRPDILHASQFCWGSVPVDIPKVITAHSDVLSWASACRSEPMPASPWLERYREFVQRGLDGADALVAPTRWMASALGANFNVGANVRIIANGRTFSLQGSVLPRRLQAVSVGRIWDESKGIQTILDVESSMPILVAGENSFEGAKQSTGKLRALGLLDEPELLQVFCESSIYIASSTYEPFGLAPLEAAMCGCAVVARDIDSFREVWADGALYFRDAAELGGMLRRLNCEKDALCQARSQSMARAQGYNADAMARGYLNLYEELTGNATSSLICLKELPVYAE